MMRPLLVLAFISVALHGQVPGNFTLFFSMDGTEAAASGAGGTAALPGNYAAVFPDEEILAVRPTTGVDTAYAVVPQSTWSAWFGDDDADGLITEAVVGNLDALHLPSSAPNPPDLFDFYLSFSNDAGPGGTLNGTVLLDGDIFRLMPGGGVEFFITEAQIESAMGAVGAPNIDVNGFTVDEATGNLYWTMTTSQVVNGIPVDDGGVVRLAASGYIANPNGTVASVLPGAATAVLAEGSLDFIYLSAGVGTVGDLDGLCIDPGGGTFTGIGVTLPNFWFVADSPTSGPAIISSASSGSIATAGSITFDSPSDIGLSSTDWAGGAVSTVTALAYVGSAPTQLPLVLDTADVGLTTPGTFSLQVGGATPGGFVFIVGTTAVGNVTGGFTPRSLLAPFSPPLAGPGSHGELFLDDFNDLLFLATFMQPPVPVNGQGYASRTYGLPLVAPGIAIATQAVDATTLRLSTPVIVVTL